MLKDLVKVASRLNSLGLSSEAHFIDAVVRKFAGDLVQFPKEVWQHKPKMKAREIREERKRREAESNAFQRKLEEDMRLQDEEDYSSPKGRHEYPSEEEMAMEEEAYRADLEERKLKRPYSSDVDISSSDIGSGKGRGGRGIDAYNMRGDFMGSKAPRRSKNRGISTPFDDDDFSDDADDMFDSDGNLIDPMDFEQEEDDEGFDQYDNPEETYFRRSEPVGPGRGRRSSYIPSDDADDMQRLAKRLASLGLIKEARTIYSIVKNAEDYLDEEEFSDDAWDDGDTGPYHYRDPRVDEEEAAMKKERMRMQEEENRRINRDYYGHDDGNFATDRWVSNRPAWRVSQT